jgi:hypothetical protein
MAIVSEHQRSFKESVNEAMQHLRVWILFNRGSGATIDIDNAIEAVSSSTISWITYLIVFSMALLTELFLSKIGALNDFRLFWVCALFIVTVVAVNRTVLGRPVRARLAMRLDAVRDAMGSQEHTLSSYRESLRRLDFSDDSRLDKSMRLCKKSLLNRADGALGAIHKRLARPAGRFYALALDNDPDKTLAFEQLKVNIAEFLGFVSDIKRLIEKADELEALGFLIQDHYKALLNYYEAVSDLLAEIHFLRERGSSDVQKEGELLPGVEWIKDAIESLSSTKKVLVDEILFQKNLAESGK